MGRNNRDSGDAGSRRVGVLNVVLIGVAAAVLFTEIDRRAAHRAPDAAIIVIAVLFVAAEIASIHIPLRRDTHTVSFSELPLAVGLFFLAPVELAAAALFGSVAVFAIHRRQRGVKLVFNLAQVGVQVVLAFAVFTALRGPDALLSTRSYVSAMAGVLAADAISAVLVTIAIALFRGSRSGELSPGMLFAGGASAVAKVSLALLAVSALVHEDAFALGLFVVCAACMYYAFYTFANLHERHRRLEKLYRFTSAVGESVEFKEIARIVVSEARTLLRATNAELVVATGRDEPLRWVAGDEDEVCVDHAVTSTPMETSTRPDRTELSTLLTGTSGVSGYLRVAGRTGLATTFDIVDARLFEALANHASIALDNGGLLEERERRANYDLMTGLPNRSHFTEMLDAALPTGERWTLFVIGLDHFKEINETLGYDSGDIVLSEIATRVGHTIPLGATVARLSGDEFAVALPVGATASFEALLEPLMRAVTAPVTVDGLSLKVGASAGAAIAPDHASNAAALIRRADTALHTAKERADRFWLYEPGSELAMRGRLTLAHELGLALARSEMVAFFQPKIDVATGGVIGAEALVRWQHPEHGLVRPDEFIPVAEHTGLIDDLTAFMLDAALGERHKWATAGFDLTVAVNFSARSLVEPSLAERVMRALIRHRCPPQRLTFEITESQLMAESDRVSECLHALRDIGVHISIDDFGTGFSSLSSLRALALSEIKIDKSFVMGIGKNESDEVIVRSTADLGHNLGLRVVAEGIDTAEALEFVRQCSIEVAQGYYFSKPRPTTEFVQWVESRRRLHSPA